MKKEIIKFYLFLQESHIQEDWTTMTSFGKRFLYPFWLVRALSIHIFFILYIPEYLIRKYKIFNKIEKIISNQMTMRLRRADNKISTNNYLNKKESE